MPKIRERIGRAWREVTEHRPELLDVGCRVDPGAAVEQRAKFAQLELERGHDPEVRAGAPDPPEELGLLRLARPHRAAVRRDELDRAKVVDRQAEVPLEAAHPAAERQPGDPGVTDHADRADEAVRLRRDIELAEERAAVCAGDAPLGVDGHAAEPREVDDEAAVGGRVARGAVTARPDRDLEIVLAPEPDGGGDIGDVRWPDEDRRSPVEHRVPDATRLVVPGVARRDDLATEGLAEAVDVSG